MASEGDRDLYDAGPGPRLASPTENARVRAMLVAELEARAAVLKQPRHETLPYGNARGEFAADWVRLAGQQGLYVPGSEQRAHYPSAAAAFKAHVEAARTRLRQFLAGQNQFGYMLCGIEVVICDRHGMAYPPCAYQVQGQLPL